MVITMRYIVLFFSALVLYALQTVLAPVMALWGILPHFLIPFIVAVSIVMGQNEGMFAGAVAGLFTDLLSSAYFGFHFLFFLYMALIVGFLFHAYFNGRPFFVFITNGIVTLLYGILFNLFYFVFAGHFHFLQVFLKISWLECLYTAFVGIFIYILVRNITRKYIREY